MKRFLMCVLVCVMIISILFSQITVFASTGTYHIDEMEITVTIPSGYSVITRDTPVYDSVFNTLGVSGTELISRFKTNGIYLNAVSNTNNEEIVITNMENILSNFALISDTALNTLASALVNEYTNQGIKVSKYDIYQHSQAKFVRMYWYDAANYTYGLQYYTIYDNNAMNFTMRSYNGRISAEQERTIKAIVDSVKYDKAPPMVDEGADTEPFIYTDSDSGVKFTVPANWIEKEFNGEREYLDAKFASTKEEGLIILFSSTDLWTEASPADRVGMSRSDINNSLFSKADISEMVNTTEDNVSMFMYNGVEYYKCETSDDKEVHGLSFDVTMTYLMRVDNGWMYSFQFGGTSDHELYSDFESLMRSVEYPVQPTHETDIDGYDDNYSYFGNIDNDDDDESKTYTGVILFVVIMVAAGAVCMVLWIAEKKKRKNKHAVSYCGICGQRLPSDSDFCHMCGTKVEREKEL